MIYFVSKYIIDVEVKTIAKEYRFYRDENGKYNIPKEFKTDVQYGSGVKTLCSIKFRINVYRCNNSKE